MHVGIDARLPYYERGGISQYIINLIRSLSSIDHENRYHVFASRKDREDYLPDGAPNFSQHKVWTPSHNRYERWALSLELFPFKLDIIHSTDFIPPAFGAKYRVITVHDLNFLLYPEFVSEESHRYYSNQIMWAVKAADHISADSHHTRRDLIDRLGVSPEKVTTIHLASNPVFEGPQSEENVQSTLDKYNLPSGFILFVGTLSPRKNVQTLLRAYHQVIHRWKIKLPLVLIGSKGWHFHELISTIKELSLGDVVRHYSGASNLELARLYRAAGVLVLPSYYEGFGLTPLEAMHSGCPVIVSNRGSLPEVVGNAGIILDPDDIKAWAASIALVLSDSAERERLTQAGFTQAHKFSWQRTAAATLAIYERCRQTR